MDTTRDMDKTDRHLSRAPVLIIDDYEDHPPDLLRLGGQRDTSPARSDVSGFSTLYNAAEKELELDAPRGRRSRQPSFSSNASQGEEDGADSSTLFPVPLTRGGILPPPRSRTPTPSDEPSRPSIPPEFIRPHQFGTIFFNPPLHTPPMPKGMHLAVRKAITSHNSESLIHLLCRHPPVVIHQMIPEFRALYKEAPAQAVNSTLGGMEKKLKRLIVGCAMGTLAYSIKCLRDAFSGFTVNKDILIELLAGATLDDIRALKANYILVTNRSLDADLTRKLMGGPFLQLCYALINVERRSAFHETNAETDAGTIYHARKKLFGTDRDMLFDILVNSTDAQLRKLCGTYNQYYRATIEKVIESEFHGYYNTTKALLALVSAARDRIAHVAGMLNEALESNDTSKLIRLVVLYRESEICRKVKIAYQKKYDTTLAQAIAEKTSGNFKDALLACIGEG
ncbi:Annexin [Gonapodya prolifera JEL478]|uniref:Annexin n=1 Tax=Gonapodya prolifera (strain JEL478) TaxID=1344416 RepID=A0A139AW90_GONPJ|nr:Annexin [Gonapodya prolifera JEL478]|eukprot:KXS20974.1 Annexin [Gonapodya prolifera JEL478]